MIGRRGLLALLGGLPFMSVMRPDQVYDPPPTSLNPASQTGLFRRITIGSTVIVSPSADRSGATDPVTVQTLLNNGFAVQLAAGTFYANATVLAHEAQTITGAGTNATFWNLTTAGIAAFQWTNANPAFYDVNGSGSLIGLTIRGPSLSVNPSDGSIGAQMADIVQLRCDIEVVRCQFPFLSSNTNFFTEQGTFRIVTHGCTNGPILQVNSTGSSNRANSFARTWVYWYPDETLNGSYGNGMQLLNGALLGPGGGIVQYGNFGGTGQANIAALLVRGVVPAGAVGAGSVAALKNAEIIQAIEYNGTGTTPAMVLLDTNTLAQDCWGNLRSDFFTTNSTITTAGNWDFRGPIFGDNNLLFANWQVINSGFPAGWSGQVNFRKDINGDVVFLDVSLQIANTTVVASPTTICTLPAGFFFTTDAKRLAAEISGGGLAEQLVPIGVNTAGALTYRGPGFTAAGTAFLFGSVSYPTLVGA